MRCLRLAGVAAVLAGVVLAGPHAPAVAGEKHYRLKDTDLKQQVIWGATCDGPDGAGLAFGGQDQQADDGRPHTRLREGGQWKAIHEALRAANPLQASHDEIRAIRDAQKTVAAHARSIYFQGLAVADEQARVRAEVVPAQKEVVRRLEAATSVLAKRTGLGGYESRQAKSSLALLEVAAAAAGPLPEALAARVTPETIKAMVAAQIDLETAAEALDAEPPPRALSPIVYDAKTGLYVLFGGDHLDYLTNDTWVFDPKARKWMQRHPPAAPPPRADHTLRAAGDGKVTLSGGYAYASNTDYCGGQYQDIGDGEWTYDAAADAWSGPAAGVPPATRVYRTGPFHPDFYLQGDRPDAAAAEKRLADLPVNTWVDMKPPYVPRQNRDWGTVRFDADRDQILVWSGGHSAHGGSDVLHYHLAANRWELPFPVEFPLGQLYSNTSYPDGYNFNGRPWVTGHTYLSYEVEPLTKRLVFAGRPRHYYVYDPDVADWVGRGEKPAGMIYGGCYYDLELVATPQGILCWGKGPKVHRFDAKAEAWQEVEVTGDLPEPAVDFSTVVYDSKRDRLLLFRTGYGKAYDGQAHALDLKDRTVRPLAPANMAAAGRRPFAIDRALYDPRGDLVIFCALLPADADGFQRTPAYDCAGNRWVSLKVGYERTDEGKPLAPGAVRHSCGLVWDARRGLIWGVDTNRVSVYALRFDATRADVMPLE